MLLQCLFQAIDRDLADEAIFWLEALVMVVGGNYKLFFFNISAIAEDAERHMGGQMPFADGGHRWSYRVGGHQAR